MKLKEGDRITIEDGLGRRQTGEVVYAAKYDDGWIIDLRTDSGNLINWKQNIDGGRIITTRRRQIK